MWHFLSNVPQTNGIVTAIFGARNIHAGGVKLSTFLGGPNEQGKRSIGGALMTGTYCSRYAEWQAAQLWVTWPRAA